MDGGQFDAITRRVFEAGTRRGFLRHVTRAGAALMAARIVLDGGSADARQCRDYGCSCNGGGLSCLPQ